MDEPRLAQADERAAQIKTQIDRARLRHRRFGQNLGEGLAVFRQQVNFKPDAVFLRLDLVAAVAADVRAGRELFQRIQLRLIIGSDLFIVVLRILDRRGRAGEHQSVDLLLRFRDADMLQIIGLIALRASDNIDRCTAAHADAFDQLHVGQQRRYQFQFGQTVRLLYKHGFILFYF